SPNHRSPTADAELHRLLGQPQHSVAVGYRCEQMDWRRFRYLADLTHIDERRALRRLYQNSNGSLPRTVAQCNTLTDANSGDFDVMRGLVVECERCAHAEGIGREKSRYRGAICTLHQPSSVSSRSITQLPLSSTAIIAPRSSIRIPDSIA